MKMLKWGSLTSFVIGCIVGAWGFYNLLRSVGSQEPIDLELEGEI